MISLHRYFLFVLVVTVFSLSHGFKWRRIGRISRAPFYCRAPRGGDGGYNFSYDDEDGANNDGNEGEPSHYNNNDNMVPPPLPGDSDEDEDEGFGSQQQNGEPINNNSMHPGFSYGDVEVEGASNNNHVSYQDSSYLNDAAGYSPYNPQSDSNRIEDPQFYGRQPPHHHSQQPPPLPPHPQYQQIDPSQQQYYQNQAPPVPPNHYQQQHPHGQPPAGSWETTPTSDSVNNNNNNDSILPTTGTADLSSFDKEYILKGLSRLYRKKILPLELSSRYGHFHSPPLSPSDFDAPPMILLLGQYSVGKTSFVKYLLGRDFPGIRVGPEPTTDRCVL